MYNYGAPLSVNIASWRSMNSLSNYPIIISHLVNCVFPTAFSNDSKRPNVLFVYNWSKTRSHFSVFVFFFGGGVVTVYFFFQNKGGGVNLKWRYKLFDQVFSDILISFGLLWCPNHSFHHLYNEMYNIKAQMRKLL